MTANVTVNITSSSNPYPYIEYYDYSVPDEYLVYLAMQVDENEVVNTLKVFKTQEGAEAFCQFCRDDEQVFLETYKFAEPEPKPHGYYVIPKPFSDM